MFGKFRVLYLGDLTWNQEFELNCPVNRIGTVDLFVASRHGQPSSNSEALVHAIQPKVTITNNGTLLWGGSGILGYGGVVFHNAGLWQSVFDSTLSSQNGVNTFINVSRTDVPRNGERPSNMCQRTTAAL